MRGVIYDRRFGRYDVSVVRAWEPRSERALVFSCYRRRSRPDPFGGDVRVKRRRGTATDEPQSLVGLGRLVATVLLASGAIESILFAVPDAHLAERSGRDAVRRRADSHDAARGTDGGRTAGHGSPELLPNLLITSARLHQIFVGRASMAPESTDVLTADEAAKHVRLA